MYCTFFGHPLPWFSYACKSGVLQADIAATDPKYWMQNRIIARICWCNQLGMLLNCMRLCTIRAQTKERPPTERQNSALPSKTFRYTSPGCRKRFPCPSKRERARVLHSQCRRSFNWETTFSGGDGSSFRPMLLANPRHVSRISEPLTLGSAYST